MFILYLEIYLTTIINEIFIFYYPHETFNFINIQKHYKTPSQ